MLLALAPIADGASRVAGSVRGTVGSVASNETLRQNNARLEDELETARQELVRLQGVEEELHRLTNAVDFTRRNAGSFFVADVVYLDPTSALRTLVLYTGTEQPRRNQAVRTPRGLVGRIIVTAGRYAKVQLITDRASAVSAMIERTRRKAMARGLAAGGIELAMLPQQADVVVGDRVVTAGIDGVYPRGIPIGEVVRAETNPSLFPEVVIRPAVDFSGLEQVYVLTTEPVPATIIEEQPGATP